MGRAAIYENINTIPEECVSVLLTVDYIVVRPIGRNAGLRVGCMGHQYHIKQYPTQQSVHSQESVFARMKADL